MRFSSKQCIQIFLNTNNTVVVEKSEITDEQTEKPPNQLKYHYSQVKHFAIYLSSCFSGYLYMYIHI